MDKEIKQAEIKIQEFLNSCNEDYYLGFFIGVSNHPEIELFFFHKVNENESKYFFTELLSNKKAKTIRDRFIAKGMDGQQKDASEGRYVYCYLVTEETFQPSRSNLGFLSLMC